MAIVTIDRAGTAAAQTDLHFGSLLQVLDSNGTWHAATVGAGVLCSTIRDAAHTMNSAESFDPTTTVQWDFGVDQVDCPDIACVAVLGRR